MGVLHHFLPALTEVALLAEVVWRELSLHLRVDPVHVDIVIVFIEELTTAYIIVPVAEPAGADDGCLERTGYRVDIWWIPYDILSLFLDAFWFSFDLGPRNVQNCPLPKQVIYKLDHEPKESIDIWVVRYNVAYLIVVTPVRIYERRVFNILLNMQSPCLTNSGMSNTVYA